MSLAESITLSNLELTRFFFALVLLLFAAHSTAVVLDRLLRVPRVIGEIMGGLLLGPTVLGYFSPGIHDWVFNAFEAEGKLLSLVSWFGLTLLMFVSGFEIERSFSEEDRNIAVGLLIGATAIPFLVGLLVASYLYDFSRYLGTNSTPVSMSILIGLALAVTSIPVISKIFIDLGVIDSRFAKIILATSTVEDVALLALLTIATGLAGPEIVSLSLIISTVLMTTAFLALVLLVMPRLVRSTMSSRLSVVITSWPIRFALFICFAFVAVASLLNINIVFGAFLAGVTVGALPKEIFGNARRHIRSMAMSFFVPIYFGIVGLKLDLARQFEPLFVLGFILFAASVTIVGALTVGKLMGRDWLSSLNLAIVTSAKGGPGIVIATVAFDLGLITETFFVALVLTAIVTSLIAGYWLRFVLSRGWTLLKAEGPPKKAP